MATLKHINSKNADYGAAEQYLLFEHDEFTMKPVLDETGRLIPREDYRLSINGAFAEKMRGQKIILNFLLSGRNNSL